MSAHGDRRVPRQVFAAFRPLRHRDFRLLWTGLAVSLGGRGLWLVALAWQVIELGGGPAELSLVSALYGVGVLAFVLVGGVLADRLPQRLVMLASDLVRAAVLLVLGALSLTGTLALWHLAVGSVLIGAGEAFFIPSYTALLPRLLPEDELLAANGLEGTLRPLAEQGAGPAVGGIAVAALSPGVAILTGGLTYVISAGCLLAMHVRPAKGSDLSASAPSSEGAASVIADLRESFRYVRETSWLWASILFALALVLLIMGPLEVLLPFAVRDNFGGGADDYGLALASFGVGGAAGALAISSGRLPRRYLTVMLLMWGFGALPFAAVGLANSLWVACALLFAVGAAFSAGLVIWGTLLQRRVPDGLRGRVSSLDFFVSLALMPVSMALAGPAGAAFGLAAVFLVAGVAPVFLAAATIMLFRLDRDELAHPLDHPKAGGPAATDQPSEKGVQGDS
ncbi:MAG TPA: MFS transporter [Rubrobacteraceae bacterium]|nr:MFS transporter [Rubrobacteraceae bacterium]